MNASNESPSPFALHSKEKGKMKREKWVGEGGLGLYDKWNVKVKNCLEDRWPYPEKGYF
jgi:hypothetical protein